MEAQLIKWNNARQAIIEAKSIDEVKAIKDKAEALRTYAKQVGESLGVQNDICEIKLRAERRAGEMLKETELADGGDATRARLHDVTELKPTLNSFGIEKQESYRFQKIAEIPDEKFEKTITEIKEEGKELTEAFMLRVAKKIESFEKGETDWLRYTTVWNFSDSGMIGEGISNLPCQMIQNFLYHYGENKGIILDPFAGSGLTKEVVDWYNKEYNTAIKSLNYDINPRQKYIKKNDVLLGFPKEVKDIDLIFLDPPYWKMIDYGKESLDKLSFEDFKDSMKQLAYNCHKVLKKGGKVGFVIMPVKDKGDYYDLAIDCYNIFREYEFKPLQRFCIPVIKQPHPVSKGNFIATLRDFMIFIK